MTHTGGHEVMTDKKKEATSIPLEDKTAAELHALLSSGVNLEIILTTFVQLFCG